MLVLVTEHTLPVYVYHSERNTTCHLVQHIFLFSSESPGAVQPPGARVSRARFPLVEDIQPVMTEQTAYTKTVGHSWVLQEACAPYIHLRSLHSLYLRGPGVLVTDQVTCSIVLWALLFLYTVSEYSIMLSLRRRTDSMAAGLEEAV